MTASGHFDPFPPLSLSDRCGFGEETLARTHRNGQDPSSAAPCGSDRPPDPLGGGRHRQVGDAERVGQARHRAEIDRDGGQIVGPGHPVIQQRAGDELALSRS